MVDDQQSNEGLKHFCKICKKGFGCGRALGGHMRAHGIGDESGAMEEDDDDAAGDWEDVGRGKFVGDANIDPSNRRMYALRTNPNRLKSCRACENCGKEFSCWKSFLEHGKCSSSDPADESFMSSPGSNEDDISGGPRGCSGWSKRKRSFRAQVGSFSSNNNPNCSSSNEEEDLANCLMMLSNATVDPLDEVSALLASKDEERRNANLSFIAPLSSSQVASDHNNKAKEVGNNNKGFFECKACKRVFNSHQALGGHRASHKKVKGCFATRLDNNLDDAGTGADDDVIPHEDKLFPTNNTSGNNSTPHLYHGSQNNNASSSSKRKSKVHECSICHRVFTSGQALGGHKRCHWITSNAPDTSTLARFKQFQDKIEQQVNNNPVIPNKFEDSDPIHLKLDLNLPAPSTRNVYTEIYLQSSRGGGRGVTKQHKDDDNRQSHLHKHRHHEADSENNDDEGNKNSNNRNVNISNGSPMQNVVEGDEADSKAKLAKLSELKDMNVGGSSLPWLQVGIGSTTTTTDVVGTDP